MEPSPEPFEAALPSYPNYRRIDIKFLPATTALGPAVEIEGAVALHDKNVEVILSEFRGLWVFISEMTMTDNQQLLSDYVANRSETAFRELVTRYIDLVFSTALRLLGGDVHGAKDAAQIVFIDLARQASNLSPDTMLGGWLHRDTCFVASKMIRGERRRRVRESQAVEMNLLNQPDTNLAQLSSALDEAINALGEVDRKAILLRFYERLDLRSVGSALGSSEDAAQKRVSRAVDQLRSMLTNRGIALSAAALSTALAGEAVRAAPLGLAASIAGVALNSALGTGSLPLGVFKAAGLTKIKASALGALAVVAVATPIVLQQQAQTRLLTENAALRRQVSQSTTLAEENQRLSNLVVQASSPPDSQSGQFHELLRLRGEVARLRQQNQEIETLRVQNRQLRLAQTSSPHPAGGEINTGAAPAPIPLYTRILKVDSDALLVHMNDSGPAVGANSRQATLRSFLKGMGAEIEPPATVFMDFTNGNLLVHASLQNLDKIEQIVSALNLGAK